MSPNWKYFIPGYLWALPHTLVGLVLMLWYRPESWHLRDGCLEAISSRDLIGGPWVGAQTHGWIVFYRDQDMYLRKSLRIHERCHVAQGLVGGPLYMLAYGIHFLWLWKVKGLEWKAAYRNIVFEAQAYRIEGEYIEGNRPGAWGDSL